MKELSERARVILERYKVAQRGPESDHTQLLETVLERARSGAPPKYDVSATPPIAPAPHLLVRFWSSAFGKLSIISALVGVSALGIHWRAPSVAQTIQAGSAALSPSASASPAADTVAEQQAPQVLPPPMAQATSSAAPSQKAAPRKAVNQPTIDEEVRLLNAAQAALRAGDSARALGLLGEHRARFLNGAMAGTRTILHMMALRQAGRTEQACAEAERFLANDPKSPFEARVKAICPRLVEPK